MTDELKPADHREAIAVFRAGIIGHLTSMTLKHGELKAELRALSKKRYRMPWRHMSKRFGVSTLERWYYAYTEGGLEALKPSLRSDKGAAQNLSKELRDLLAAIKEEHPSASAELILGALEAEGRIAPGVISPATVRRLFSERGLGRDFRRQAAEGAERRRWQAEYPGQLWHADVCHGPALLVGGQRTPLRIHAILDDASRYVVAIQACDNEREVEMLGLMVKALEAHGRPGTLYLDNGATYVGRALATMTARLQVGLLHARPYDPQARGKMERFWRTLRIQCLDHMGTVTSLHDVQVRLLGWLDGWYHRRPHAGLFGRTPGDEWQSHRCDPVRPEALEGALTVRERRRVRKDGTLSVGGVDWELDLATLHGHHVQIGRCLLIPQRMPWVEHEGRRLPLKPVDPRANASRPRQKFTPRPGLDAVPFDPSKAFLDALLNRKETRR